MRSARIICVGRLKTECWKTACAHYLRLLGPIRPVEITEARDGDARLESGVRVRQEGERLLAALKRNDFPIALWEQGQMLTSREFAALLKDCDERKLKCPTFIIGGPFGLAEQVLQAASLKLSLSPMTWPHELARVLLIEQIYRAETILRNGHYHH